MKVYRVENLGVNVKILHFSSDISANTYWETLFSVTHVQIKTVGVFYRLLKTKILMQFFSGCYAVIN